MFMVKYLLPVFQKEEEKKDEILRDPPPPPPFRVDLTPPNSGFAPPPIQISEYAHALVCMREAFPNMDNLA